MLKRLFVVALVVVAASVALVGVAYAVDRARGVRLAGRTVEGDPADEIAAALAGFADRPVVVRTPDGELRSTTGELGMQVDVAATRAAVLDARRGGPLEWLRGLLRQRDAPLIVQAEADAMRSVVRVKDPTEREDPREPAVFGGPDGIAVRRGAPGRGLDAVDVADALREAARAGAPVIEAAVEPTDLPPRFALADAEALAERARGLTTVPLAVRAGDVRSEVNPATLRSWVRSTDLLELDLDAEAVIGDLRDALADAASPAVDARFVVQGGRPVIVPGKRGTRCCGADTPDRILAALLERPTEPVTVPLEAFDPARTSDDLRALRVVEQVGSFTTRFAAGQSRVRNIHRIAEIVDGTLIGPGGRFSVNDKVGQRTTAKGFVAGGAIQDGMFVESVGGGISQFATTLFNAAFFAGLDIPEYQAHSIYISRYPYGREATLSWPKPDLVIRNATPYGVLVDTSYTASSVTVTLWSTRHAAGEQTGQSESPVGNGCTRVKTERTRTFTDGRTVVDHVYATYRPEEGVRC